MLGVTFTFASYLANILHEKDKGEKEPKISSLII